jgi:hypothetical protein
MLARTRLLRQTRRVACARSFAQKVTSAAPKAVLEQATAAELPATGGE